MNPSDHALTQDRGEWRTLEVEKRFTSPWLNVATHCVATPTRPRGVKWDVVNRKAAVVVAPITAKNEFVLVRQERIPVRQALWEFPAGQIEAPAGQETGEASIILATAVRELQEEAGYRLRPGGRWEQLGFYFTSAAFTDEHSHLLAAIGVEPDPEGSAPEEDEAIVECRVFPRAEFRAMIASGEIRDANTLALFARLTARGL